MLLSFLKTLPGKIYNNFLLLFIFILLSFLYLFFAIVIDLKYQVEKKEYIVNNYEKFFKIDRLTIITLLLEYQKQNNLIQKKKIEDRLKKIFENIVNNSNICIYKINLLDKSDNLILKVENFQKMKKNNTLQTSLFFKNFYGVYTFGRDVLKYKVECFYTTPVHPYIIKITKKYWGYVFSLSLIYVLIIYFILKYYILPVKRVINSISCIKDDFLYFIYSPKTTLEKAYNLIVFYYKLTDFSNFMYQKIIGEFIKEEEFINYLKNELLSYFPCDKVFIFESVNSSFARKYPFTEFNNLFSKNLKKGWVYLIKIENKVTIALCFSKFHPEKITIGFSEFVNKLEKIINLIYRYLDLRRKFIIEEKNRANINLVRNLGHDITNILATAKLELSNLKLLVKISRKKIDSEVLSKIRPIFKSLEDNFYFLQEIINIYRSLSFMDNPVFENVDICNLIKEIVKIYQKTTSQKIDWKVKIPSHSINLNVEPRLIRLAIFNILSNAYEAVKEIQEEYVPQITISLNENENKIFIKIKDNGKGIRDKNGKILLEDEIDRIFEYGYTTKKKKMGEGLGLNWVKFIIENLHKGQISAHNLKDKGAEFVITLKK